MPQATSPSPTHATPTGDERGKLIVVFGTKGGVGKTLVATNVAVSLAKRRGAQTVCLVDLDVIAVGDIARMLRLSVPRTIAGLAPSLKQPASRERFSFDGVVVPHPSGVHVLSCLSTPRELSQFDPKLLSTVLPLLKRRYEYVIVDGGKAFSEVLIEACDQANLILLVTTPDIVTLYQTKWALSTLEQLLFPSMMVKLVLNRAESIGGVDSKDVQATIPCEIVGQIPSDGRTVGMSVNQGVPLVTTFSHTRVAEAFTRLTELLETRPDLYVTRRDIPRHHRGGEAEPLASSGLSLWTSRFLTDEAASAVEATDEIAALKRRIHEQLVEQLDLKRLDLATVANTTQLQALRQKTERVISNLLAREVGGLAFSHEVRARLVKEIADETLGLGPLEELLGDPEVTDILVNNKDEIYVERHGKLQFTNKKFMSSEHVRTVIERIVAPIGRRIDEATPMVDARLPDGSRVNAIIPPLSIGGPVLSIRKFARQRYTLEDLMRLRTLHEPMAMLLRVCVLLRKNLIVSGGTGSGKTTLLNVLSAFIPDGERIITIEDAVELKLAQRHWVRLEARPANMEGRGQVATRDLFRNALRMRPDRIIIGECRGAESLDMLQAMNTGHDGSMTTIHANSPHDVISRLDSMVLMSNIELPVRAIREMAASAVHLIIHTARISDGSRKITSVSEVVGMEGESDVVLRELFGFRQTGTSPDGAVIGEFVATGHRPTFLEEVRVKGLELPEALFAPPQTPAGYTA